MNNQEIKTYTFHIHGMHCKACVFLTESELIDLPHVTSAKSNLHTHSVVLSGYFEEQTPQEIASNLSAVLEKHGYSVSVEKEIKIAQWADFKIAVPIAFGFIILFIVLQKIGLINLVNASKVTYGTAFIIGIIASLSTCMAVVGGLLLSISATYAKQGEKMKPHILFHIGRIVSFFLLGGVIGAIGSAFALNTFSTFIVSLLIGVVMLMLGINLLDIFPWAKKFQPSMPHIISKHAHGVSKINHTLTPLAIGLATFFLPCGFTQSMQIYTLSTGSFLSGGLTMLAFALGTLPVLALISFSSFNIQKSSKAGVFFKTAGLIVILFALFNIINSFVVIGLLPPIFTL